MKAYAGEFLVVKVAFTRYSIPNTLTPFQKKKKKQNKKSSFFVTYYLSCDCQRNCNCKKNQRSRTDQPLFLGRRKKQQLVHEKVEN